MERRKFIAKKLLFIRSLQISYLTNQRGGKSEIISSSPQKRKLRQDQEKITETNKNHIKPKQKNPKLKQNSQ